MGKNLFIEVIRRHKRRKKGANPYKHTKTYEVSDAMIFAEMAIAQLESIRDDDPKKKEALQYVIGWIKRRESWKNER
jgi:hypothetical protein